MIKHYSDCSEERTSREKCKRLRVQLAREDLNTAQNMKVRGIYFF